MRKQTFLTSVYEIPSHASHLSSSVTGWFFFVSLKAPWVPAYQAILHNEKFFFLADAGNFDKKKILSASGFENGKASMSEGFR